MLAKIFSSAIAGLDAVPVEVEVDIASQGLPSFAIVGLPDKAVEEAKERVRSAIRNSGAEFPARRITVNLAPADLPKEGASYDLPIALGVLLASGQIPGDVTDSLFTGELSLDGRLRATKGILSHTLLAKKEQFKNVFVPAANIDEATIVSDITIYPLETLLQLFRFLQKTVLLEPAPHRPLAQDDEVLSSENDMQDIHGQVQAKRALEIAAAGAHNLLFKGPPGAGKTLLARTLPSILPPLTLSEAIEVTKIYSITGYLKHEKMRTTRPFRAPHHTISHIGLIGGGSNPQPGEITLAHRGVLFLDELPEFPRNVLEALRQPLEDGHVTISRVNGKVTFPTKCLLIAAQNPCACGFYGDTTHQCRCLPTQLLRYQKRLSGPLLDRIDMHIDVPAVKVEKLTSADKTKNGDSSRIIRARVIKARERQMKRFQDTPFLTNADMTNKYMQTYCPLQDDSVALLRQAVEKLHLSARSYHRTIKLARTIADLSDSEMITTAHIAEALQFRPRLDSIL